jgi:hypothetical protein
MPAGKLLSINMTMSLFNSSGIEDQADWPGEPMRSVRLTWKNDGAMAVT